MQASPPSGALAIWLRAFLWLLLGGWLGAWIFFAFSVAPTAFRVLPSTEIAGRLVGPVLAALHLYGAGAGIALAALAWALGRSGWSTWIPLAMSTLCLVSHFGVTTRIEAIRALAFGPSGSPEMAAHFQLLHQVSMGIYTSVGLAGFLLVAIHARADGPGALASLGPLPRC
jgi:hypothetical protein